MSKLILRLSLIIVGLSAPFGAWALVVDKPIDAVAIEDGSAALEALPNAEFPAGLEEAACQMRTTDLASDETAGEDSTGDYAAACCWFFYHGRWWCVSCY